jgi:hypothetical protein
MSRIALGIETDAPGNYQTKLNNREKKIVEAVQENQNIKDDFQQALIVSNFDNADGTVYTGATAEVLSFHSGKAAYEVYQAAVNSAAVIAPFQSASGLELKPVAAADALELTVGTTALSKAAYVIGSLASNKKIYMEATIEIDDISDVTEIFFGWRKAEAYQADPDSYDEMASFNIGKDADGQIEIHTILNNAATDEVDTTLTDWVDTGSHTLRIEVDNNGKCVFLYDGAVPTITKQFSFDDAEVIVPFIHLNTETGDPGVSISNLEIGYM